MKRRRVLSIAATMVLGLALPQGNAVAQTAKDLVGTWTNVSNVNIRPDGTRTNSFGPKGTGIVIFETNGRYAIININTDVPKFASSNRAQGNGGGKQGRHGRRHRALRHVYV